MIENKFIKLSVANEFDKGWALFHPFAPGFNVEKNRGEIAPSAIIPKITKAEKINIVLAEICLTSNILRELEWVSKYIPIDLIARNEQIASFYSSKFKITDIRIDSDITLNYLAILSNEPFYVLIGEGYAEVDSTLNNVYFGNKGSDSFDFSSIAEVYAIDFSVNPNILDFVKSFKGTTIYYLIPKDAYNKSVYDTFKNSTNNLLVGEVFRNGIIVVDKTGNLFLLHKLKSGVLFKEKISSISGFAKGLYKCELLNERIDYSVISKDFYIWENGVLVPISIDPSITIKKSVQMNDMRSFIAEEFDRSIMDLHNDYSGRAECVEYIFDLIPPILPENSQYSELYGVLSDYLKEWKTLRISIFTECAEEVLKIANISKLYSMCFNFQVWDKWLKNAVERYEFGNFSTKLLEFKAFLEESRKNLLLYMGEIYASLGISNDSGRFDKIDTEIAGYEQTIAEKQALLDQKIDVLSNKRRIEILQKKINDLLALKAHFEKDSGNRTDKATAAFVSKCQDYLKGVKKRENDDSLGNIVKAKEESKENLLEAFASEHLYVLNEQLEKCLLAVNKMCSIEIPDDYTVYDAEGKRMIVIGEISEFKKTKEIQEKYNLKCVVRR